MVHDDVARFDARAAAWDANPFRRKLSGDIVRAMIRPPLEALSIFEALLSRGIIVRALKSYGLPELLRISIGNDEENSLFLAAFREICDHVQCI